MDYKLRWSEESLRNLNEILDYLNFRWSEREVNNFKKKLNRQLDLIMLNPFMFPKSQYQQRLRKAVLSKQTTIFYEIQDDIVFIVYLHVNKKDVSKIK